MQQNNKFSLLLIINELSLLLLLVMNLQVNHHIQLNILVLFLLVRRQVLDRSQVFQIDEEIFYLHEQVLLVPV